MYRIFEVDLIVDAILEMRERLQGAENKARRELEEKKKLLFQGGKARQKKLNSNV